jgi:hypothetical protein
MFKPLLRAAAPVLLLTSVPLAARQPAPVAAADMLRHIRLLASDDDRGRAPAGELADLAAYARAQRTAE